MSASTSGNNEKKICKLCNVSEGKYVCPRCNLLYCSVGCYKAEAHAQCSESFYKQCVEEEVQLRRLEDPENATKMEDILSRLQQGIGEGLPSEDADEEGSDSDEADSLPDLAERLAGVDLDDAEAVWESLSEEERRGFEQLLGAEEAQEEILVPWEPWWTFWQEKKMVEEVGETEDRRYQEKCPHINTSIPALSDTSKVSPAVEFGVMNCVMAYCCVARRFNGEHQGELQGEAGDALLRLGGSLGRGQNFLEAEAAVGAAALEATQTLGFTKESVELAKEDLDLVMRGPSEDLPRFYVLAALSDCHALLARLKVLLNSQSDPGQRRRQDSSGAFAKRFVQTSSSGEWTKKQVSLAIKKLEFYISWTKARI